MRSVIRQSLEAAFFTIGSFKLKMRGEGPTSLAHLMCAHVAVCAPGEIRDALAVYQAKSEHWRGRVQQGEYAAGSRSGCSRESDLGDHFDRARRRIITADAQQPEVAS